MQDTPAVLYGWSNYKRKPRRLEATVQQSPATAAAIGTS